MEDEIIDAQAEIEDDLDEVSEQLAVLTIVNEERHAEILREFEQCQSRVESLSTRLAQTDLATESPIQTELLRELKELRSEVGTLKTELTLLREEIPSRLAEPVRSTDVPEPVVLPVVEAPPPPPTPEPKKRRRIF